MRGETDYHHIIHKKLRRLAQAIKTAAQEQVKSKVYVDSGPILEREYAQKAGIGWIGKNTNLINWQSGVLVFSRGTARQRQIGLRLPAAAR